MIPIYIGSSARFADVERLTAASILQNTRADVDIRILRPTYYGMRETGCTGFTNVRYAVPELLREHGYEHGIYLDVDMVVLADIAELFDYRWAFRWVALIDGSTEVSIFHYSQEFPARGELHNYHKSVLNNGAKPCIPLEWNCEDRAGGKLLHFTNLKTQPWLFEHPCAEAVAIYDRYNHYARQIPRGLAWRRQGNYMRRGFDNGGDDAAAGNVTEMGREILH